MGADSLNWFHYSYIVMLVGLWLLKLSYEDGGQEW